MTIINTFIVSCRIYTYTHKIYTYMYTQITSYLSSVKSPETRKEVSLSLRKISQSLIGFSKKFELRRSCWRRWTSLSIIFFLNFKRHFCPLSVINDYQEEERKKDFEELGRRLRLRQNIGWISRGSLVKQYIYGALIKRI